MTQSKTPASIHVLAKPTGAICNLDCSYCFFLDKELLYPKSKFRMSDEVLENYIRQLIEFHRTPQVSVAWQGGEPTLMGIDFFRKAIAFQEKYKKPGMTFENSMQTNATLLNDEWCEFFKENNFLLGVSIDGPRELHDANRVDKGGKPTFDKVMRGLRLLQKHGVEFNVLTTVNRVNGDYPLEVYRFLRDEVGANWMQFIPIVERINEDGLTLYQKGNTVSDRSVKAEQYGQFLIAIYDEWVRNDVGKVYIQGFEAALSNWLGLGFSGVCLFDATCGKALAFEHNGDLYSCDHFVEPDYLLGNIQQDSMRDLVVSPQQQKFGKDKSDSLPKYCRNCDVRFACHGECPKNRFINTPDGEPGLNYLCAGYKAFFHHIDRSMQIMAELVRRKYPVKLIMSILAEEEAKFAKARPNDPCPCGSELKFKKCHGSKEISSKEKAKRR
ncbi:anaerobic sulfatase maturase [Planktothrix sp. FACHB-1355]|uniref:Anaerobic sulfatase maturase n=1 Tax=Aerosakkonema funiforme FACHB-1375 TaxID=2949571 RepID=A0A926VAZ2_9CYAN|nr:MULTISPECIES: anaerobic sulfatase maturase [Oscillatoriales]MBD2180461.1 anaerobic sulfatase maturase [Aerosakkonema funiforme FACHB-1375]MBD3560280.1 anaerobic sulfatase maturase [Planktothrix sp. FACHB-1355]